MAPSRRLAPRRCTAGTSPHRRTTATGTRPCSTAATRRSWTAPLPFVEQGLALGHAVMVAVPAPRLSRCVRPSVPGQGRHARRHDAGWGATRLASSRRGSSSSTSRAATAVRSVGSAEPLWPGRHPAERAECRLHETLLNLAFDPGTPLWLRCAYDVERLSDAEIRLAAQSHHPGSCAAPPRPQPGYLGPACGAVALGTDLPAPPVTAEVLLFGRGNVRDVRQQVSASAAIDAGLGPGAHRRPDAGHVGAGRQQRPARWRRGRAPHLAGARARWSVRSATAATSTTRSRGAGHPGGRDAGSAASGWSTSCATWCSCAPTHTAPRCGSSAGCASPACGPAGPAGRLSRAERVDDGLHPDHAVREEKRVDAASIAWPPPLALHSR